MNRIKTIIKLVAIASCFVITSAWTSIAFAVTRSGFGI